MFANKIVKISLSVATFVIIALALGTEKTGAITQYSWVDTFGLNQPVNWSQLYSNYSGRHFGINRIQDEYKNGDYVTTFRFVNFTNYNISINLTKMYNACPNKTTGACVENSKFVDTILVIPASGYVDLTLKASDVYTTHANCGIYQFDIFVTGSVTLGNDCYWDYQVRTLGIDMYRYFPRRACVAAGVPIYNNGSLYTGPDAYSSVVFGIYHSLNICVPTPTPTTRPTNTPTPTVRPTVTPTPTTRPTNTPTPTVRPSVTPTRTPTPTVRPTVTPTPTTRPTNTPTPTVRPSVTPTRTPTPTVRPTVTPTPTTRPTNTPTPMRTPTPTNTPVPTLTPTNTPTPTVTPAVIGDRINFEISKKVRVVGATEWVEKVTGLKKDQIVEFNVVVKNTGNITVTEIKIIDILPTNLVLTSEFSQWTITNLAPNGVVNMTLKAKAITNGIAANTDTCVTNVANLIYQNQVKTSDTAEVCITTKGQILSNLTTLPDTGLLDSTNTLIGLIVVALLSGAIAFNLSLIIEEKVRR